MWGVGVDLGKHQDPTAIIVVERVPRIFDPNLPNLPAQDVGILKKPRKIIQTYVVRHMARPILGTDYSVIENQVVDLMASPQLLDETRLIVDLGNVGEAVFERWNEVHGLAPLGIRIAAGSRQSPPSRTSEGYIVSKANLISPLMLVFSTRRLKFSKFDPVKQPEQARLAKIIANELVNFKLDFTPKGNMLFEARQGEHDDLVLALAMVIWYFEKTYKDIFDEGDLDDQVAKRSKQALDYNPLWDDEDGV